jgi:hypothetical protein
MPTNLPRTNGLEAVRFPEIHRGRAYMQKKKGLHQWLI